jgi:hypothetical protein
MTMKKTILLALTLLSSTLALAQVNVNGATVNASQGYQMAGAAPDGHTLCGNGARYVDAASCGASAFYQFVQANGTNLTQRATLNFDSNFSPVDASPVTLVHLASTITATAANANAVGGVALAGLCQSGGTGCPGATFTGTSGYQKLPSGLILEWIVGAQQSDVSGSSNPTEVLTMPFTCPTAVLMPPVVGILVAAGLPGGDDTHGPTEALVSYTTTSVTTQRYRLADHGSDPSAPVVYVICY